MSSGKPKKAYVRADDAPNADSLADEPIGALFEAEQHDQPYWSPSPTCNVCGEPSGEDSTAYLCARCKRVLGKNLTAEQKLARFEHMHEQWGDHGEFRCTYTGVRLELNDRAHVRYREWEHATPGEEGSVVLAAALVNRMKCYLDVAEFRRMVAELARYFADPGEPFDDTVFPARSVPPSAEE